MRFQYIYQEFEKLMNDEKYVKNICEKINELEIGNSKEVYDNLIAFEKSNNLEYAYAWTIKNYGRTYYFLGDINNSIKVNEEALSIFKEKEDTEGILSSINALVANYSIQQMFDKAIEYGLDGISIAEKTGQYRMLSSIKNNIGIAYMELGEFNKAKTIFEQIIKMPNIDAKYNQIVNMLNLAECERKTDGYKKAIEYLEKALQMANIFEDSLIPCVLQEIGITYSEKGEYYTAYECFDECVKILMKNGPQLYMNDALTYWAELEIKMDMYNEAINKLKEVELSIRNVGSRRNEKKIYYNMSVAYEKLGDYENAYKYLKKFNEIEKSISEKKKSDSIKQLDKKREEEEEKVYKILYNQTEALYSVGQRITADLNKKNIYKIIAQEMENLIRCDVLQIAIINESSNMLEYQLCMELGCRLEMTPIPLEGKSLAAYSVKKSQDILINDLIKDYYRYYDDLDEYMDRSYKGQNSIIGQFTQSMIFVPIIINNKVIGVMSTQCYEKDAYSLKDVTTLKILSTYMGIALENARLYKEVKYNASYDGLTKILNRREILRISEDIYSKVKDGENSYYIMMIDVDNFKVINDTYGHQVGDKVLERIAFEIKASLRKDDAAGRYGGEEFIAIINADRRSYLNIAERIRKRIEGIRISTEADEEIKVTSSIGIACIDSKSKTIEQIISSADYALYEAKRTGKNKVISYVERVIKV